MGSTEKKDYITLEIELDDKKMPSSIYWSASGKSKQGSDSDEVKAFFLSMFDAKSRDTLEMDLWTTKMQIIEMDRFVYQSLSALTGLYMRATNNRELGEQMQQFVHYFGQKTEIIKK
jgi:gliding motility-associated protein GldC